MTRHGSAGCCLFMMCVLGASCTLGCSQHDQTHLATPSQREALPEPAADLVTEQQRVYSVRVTDGMPELEFPLPRVRQGELKKFPEDAFGIRGSYILFNDFPGQPGVTLFGLSRTWMLRASVDRVTEYSELDSPEYQSDFRSRSGIVGKVWILASPFAANANLEELNAKEVLDLGIAPLKQLPRVFLFEFARGDKVVTLMMIGAPPNEEKPSDWAEQVAAALRWKR